jgi:hypothetical protein
VVGERQQQQRETEQIGGQPDDQLHQQDGGRPKRQDVIAALGVVDPPLQREEDTGDQPVGDAGQPAAERARDDHRGDHAGPGSEHEERADRRQHPANDHGGPRSAWSGPMAPIPR